MPRLSWELPEAADALGGERRWADAQGNLTPDFTELPGYPRLALIVGGNVVLEGERLPVSVLESRTTSNA